MIRSGESALRIIAVGDELLEGRTADTNSQRIQRALGLHVTRAAGVEVVPDQAEVISAALDRTSSGDLVFLCGGLGSTPDDLTREAVADWAGAQLIEDPSLRARLEERLRRRGIPVKPTVLNQCLVPVGMEPLENPIGSAPALVGDLRERTLVLLPGVPGELEGLLPLVVDWLAERGLLPTAREARLWRTAQAPELAVVRRCDEVRERFPGLEWSYWLTRWGVDVRAAVSGTSVVDLDSMTAEVDAALGSLVYARTMTPLPECVQNILIDRKQTLAVAESCTAGLLGGALTDAAGSSAFFRGGFLTYANEVKEQLLGVAQQDLIDHGAVSESVVRAMAEGCRERMSTDYALAVSGISGPGGGTAEKPVGTTWIAVATPVKTFAGCYRFLADRERNRDLTVAIAIDALRRVLETGDEESPFHIDDFWTPKS